MEQHSSIRRTTRQIASELKRGDGRSGSHVPEQIRRVAKLLGNNSGKNRSEQRSHDRFGVILECRLNIDTEGLGAVRGHDGYVHNLSRGGIGLLIDEPHTKDDLIEIRIVINGVPTFLCGVVVFCRHIEGNIHEVGVQLHQRGDKPMLAHYAASSDKDNPAWYNEARTRLGESRSDKKRSA